MFQSRGNYVLIGSKPVTFNGVTVGLKDVMPRMAQNWNARNPGPAPAPDPVPTGEAPTVAGEVSQGVEGFALRVTVTGP